MKVQELSQVFKALSDETRLRILKLLELGELCVCDIVAGLQMVQPKISFHLAVLKDAGFIKDRKEGRWTHYSLDDSDIFRRFLILSVLEKIPAESLGEDRRRLQVFMKGKAPALSLSMPETEQKPECCGKVHDLITGPKQK